MLNDQMDEAHNEMEKQEKEWERKMHPSQLGPNGGPNRDNEPEMCEHCGAEIDPDSGLCYCTGLEIYNITQRNET